MTATTSEVITESSDSSVVETTVEPKKAKPSKKEKKTDEPLSVDGMVIYTDAGARPNPGFAGWGLHGYTYNLGPAKKGSGNHQAYITSNGYVTKSEVKTKPDEVIPLKYLDGLGSIPECSNNAGEVVAMSEGLRHAMLQGVKKVRVLADSKYAIEGAMRGLPVWQKNNWIKSDGTELKNASEWKNLAIALEKIKEAGIDLSIEWVKGHGTNVGNNKADNYASLGVMASRFNVHRACITTTPPEGYWGKEDHHPFLSLKCAYFLSDPACNQAGEYYLGDHGKEDELMGKRSADTSYAYVNLHQADDMVELARKYILANAPGTDSLVHATLSTLFSQAFMKEVDLMDTFAFVRQGHRFDAYTVRKEPVIIELYPPKIATRAIDAVNHLKGVMTTWKAGNDERMASTDITGKFYETNAKGELSLSKTFAPGFTSMKVGASYRAVDGGLKSTDVELTLGVDMPERNALKRIEALKPKVTLVTWREDNAIRYATIIETEDASGIWAGYYANIKFVQ